MMRTMRPGYTGWLKHFAPRIEQLFAEGRKPLDVARTVVDEDLADPNSHLRRWGHYHNRYSLVQSARGTLDYAFPDYCSNRLVPHRADRATAAALYATGITYMEIGRRMGISATRVKQILAARRRHLDHTLMILGAIARDCARARYTEGPPFPPGEEQVWTPERQHAAGPPKN